MKRKNEIKASPFSKLIEKYFLKVRYVTSIDKDNYEEPDTTNPDYSVIVLSSDNIKKQYDAIRFLSQYLGMEKVLSRLKRPDCRAYLAVCNCTSSDPLGHNSIF